MLDERQRATRIQHRNKIVAIGNDLRRTRRVEGRQGEGLRAEGRIQAADVVNDESGRIDGRLLDIGRPRQRLAVRAVARRRNPL